MLVGEVSGMTGISVRMLRHYDKTGLVSPSGRTPNGYRQYSDQDVTKLFQVEGLRSLGLSLTDTAAVFNDPSFRPAALVEEMVARTRNRLEQEEELLSRLLQVQGSQPDSWSDVMRIVALVHSLSSTDPSTRQELALSITGRDGDEIAPLLEAALNEGDPNAAGALDWALARSGDEVLPVLKHVLHTAEPRQRRRAMEILRKINSAAALSIAAEAFQDPDPLVRTRATIARATSGEADTIPALVALITDGRDDIDASDALAALGQHGNAADIAATLTAAVDAATGQSRQRLTAALGGIPGAEAEEVLKRLSKDPDRAVATTATFLLRDRDRSPGI